MALRGMGVFSGAEQNAAPGSLPYAPATAYSSPAAPGFCRSNERHAVAGGNATPRRRESGIGLDTKLEVK
jgi:hypothetical protein